MMGHRPVLLLSQNTQRESGRKVQSGNINTAKTIADIIWTCLGPKSMMKMLLDPAGGIVMTNDGNAILREIQVQHPAAKSMIEISRTRDEEVGDGTTAVIILAGEMLSVAEHFLEQQTHPTVVISAYHMALDDMVSTLKEISTPVDVNNHDMMLNIIIALLLQKSSVGGPLWHATLHWMLLRLFSSKRMAERKLTSRSMQGWKRYPGVSLKTRVSYVEL